MTKPQLASDVEAQILAALEQALLAQSAKAASIFIPPANSREYSCSVEGCERPAYAGGLCNAHYIRARKGLPMAAPVRARKRDGLCSVCGKESGSKGGWGMCGMHYRQARYAAMKDAAIATLGGKCATCGGVFHRAAFEFHHLAEKTEHPSALFLNKSAAVIAKELAGCVLLCANCHRLEHYDELRRGIREVARA